VTFADHRHLPAADVPDDVPDEVRPWTDPHLPGAERVDALLARMSLAEKVGQLGSAWLSTSASGGNVAPMETTLRQAGRHFAGLREHGLGHLTRVYGSTPVTAAEGAAKVVELQGELVGQTRLGVPAIAHEECLTGFTSLGATVYPASIAWGATFDPDLVERMAHAIGADLAALGVHQGLSPVMDVVRDYRWGRVEETMGEDPYAVAVLGSAYVRGLERAGVVATLKHFAGYSASRGARNHGPVGMGPREFRDLILPPFETALREGGARSVMNSYADVDGVPAAADVTLLTGVLRDEWGFEGTVVSDYWAVVYLQTMHRLAGSTGEAARLALIAGIDVELPETLCYAELVTEVESGRLDEAVVDRAVRRVLRQKAELGLLDAGWTPRGSVARAGEVELDSAANRGLAREVAERSVILLANDQGLLPLTPSLEAGARIAVIGPCADDPLTFMGCYSYPNHVLPNHPGLGIGVEAQSFHAALLAELPQCSVTLSPGCPIREADRSGFDAAVAAARAADVVIAVVGDHAGMFGMGTSGEGCDAEDLTLPGVQHDLVERLLDSGTPVVLVVVSGRPYALGAYTGRAAAIVQAFMPGEEGGGAIAGVLSGRVNPGGRCPVQIPRTPGGGPGTYLQPPLGMTADGVSNLDSTPAFPFGHGLSYTSFAYSDLVMGREAVPTDGAVDIAVTVTNTGERAGDEVVQLYLHDVQAQVTRPVRQLAGFARLALASGASQRVTFHLHADRTAFTGLDLRRVVEPGEIEVHVGRSVADTPCSARFTLTGPARVVGHDRALTTPVTLTKHWA
jgi:beta-xylosidase